MGGGGSNIYGALPCGKIYTVFVPAGGRQWSLQYCEKKENVGVSQPQTRSAIVHTELPLLPPEVQEVYDFQRLPLPPDKHHKMLILRGAIGEDGKVDGLEVFQGLLPVMDAAARLAFGQWTFKPAMRSGKSVRVEVLVSVAGE
jgi:hypothetical protein